MAVPLQSKVLRPLQARWVVQEALRVDEALARQQRRVGPEAELVPRQPRSEVTKKASLVAWAAPSQRPAAEALTEPGAGEWARVSNDTAAAAVARD